MFIMHGMTNQEMATFRSIKAVAKTDIAEAKTMASRWIKAAKSTVARQRRKNMCRAVKFLHS